MPAAVLVLALALSGCGRGGETTGSTPEPASPKESRTAAATGTPTTGATAAGGAGKPACELLAAAEVGDALGVPMGEGKPRGAGGGTGATACLWDSTEPTSASLTLSEVQVGRNIQPVCDSTRKGLDEPAVPGAERVAGVEDVSRVGDGAWWVAYRETCGVTAGDVIGSLLVCVTSRAGASAVHHLHRGPRPGAGEDRGDGAGNEGGRRSVAAGLAGPIMAR